MALNVSLKLLKAFLALCEHRNFTRAAEHCHVSQSAFSGMIFRLEDEVGTRLFDRDTRNVALTPEGELFAEAAQHLVSDIQWTFSNLNDYVTKKKGRVRVAALPSIAGEWLPQIIAEYRRRYPGINVEIHDVLSDHCLELLQNGLVDIAMAAPNVPPEQYASELFYADSFFLICRRDHPLATREMVAIDDLRGCDFIHLAGTASIHQFVVKAIGATGVNPSSFEIRNLATMAGLILQGLGVSLLPELTLYQFRHPELTTIPLAPPGISRSIHIIWRKDRPLSVAAEAMLELIRATKPVLNR
ncbi:LysR family transcriptional regulator [Propionivibrio dicarboxylicus]|uniref:DNA-binding transcriptional regulator, LysR family n=1 Tax=Propionivibrio dicarboxylicus TaxID=83767 RepID=A0A1G8J4N0_9RHOO|nr:LysR family transcriptional regulator [Propionivibrio dicarboxylicus]SDI26013.1 DNA-binding transcriptional regulator, LysR family [Propionivibrio dicarboxylicus]